MSQLDVINSISVVPVGADLTTGVTTLSVIRGIEKMFRKDNPSSSGLALDQGEWGVLQSDGTVARPGSSSVQETYLCFCGTTRFDSYATGQVTLIMNSPVIALSSYFNAGGSYAVGTQLTVKNLSTGAAGVTPATTGDWVVAKVLDASNSGYLIYEVYSTPVVHP